MFDLREAFKDDGEITVIEVCRPSSEVTSAIMRAMYSINQRQFAFSDRGNDTKQYAFCSEAEYERRGEQLMASCRNSLGGHVTLASLAQ